MFACSTCYTRLHRTTTAVSLILVSLLLVFLLGGEFSSAFAKSVKIHVSSLIKGGKTVKSLYLPADADREKEIEREVEEIFITMAVSLCS